MAKKLIYQSTDKKEFLEYTKRFYEEDKAGVRKYWVITLVTEPLSDVEGMFYYPSMGCTCPYMGADTITYQCFVED